LSDNHAAKLGVDLFQCGAQARDGTIVFVGHNLICQVVSLKLTFDA
jgi:hypothetical protein